MILRGSVYSRALRMETGIAVLTPGDFTGDRPYRVCYLLHGLCGGNGDYLNYTMLPWYAARLGTVFIMPEVARSFYADMRRGQKYFTYVAEELPRIAGRLFNISSARSDTAVAGCSMGGYGALKCALSYPERYGYCAAFSSSCLFLQEDLASLATPEGAAAARDAFGEQLSIDFAAAFGEDLEWRREDDLLALARGIDDAAEKPELFLACGDKDPFLAGNRRFSGDIRDAGFKVVYRESPGEHNWMFFDTALRSALEWLYPDAGLAALQNATVPQ